MPLPILVVDDDPFFLRIVSDLLAKRGHKSVTADTVPGAIDAFAREDFDVVVTDLVMPGADGISLVARLREKRPDQEFILVSSTKDSQTSLTALRAGVSDYLVKPVDETDLFLAVDRAVERAQLRRDRARLLDENQEFARAQDLQARCLDLLSNPELEWLQERVLADMTGIGDAQSGALWIADERGGFQLRAYRGLLDKQILGEKLEVTGAIAQHLNDGSPWVEGAARARALYVPLNAAGETMGVALISDPLSGNFRDDQISALKTLASFAAVAVRNGRRILSLQRLGLRDRDTAAYNLSYFTDYASKEIYKARRYGRTFSLLTFSIDNLPQARQRLGATEARKANRGIIRALSKIIRDSDVIAKASESEFYMLLPETDFFGAMMFVRRAMTAVRDEPEVQEVESRLPLGLVSGASTYPKDGEDFDELVHRCRRRMDERRVSLQRKLHLDGLPFWDEVELLLGSSSSPKLPVDDVSEPSRRGKVADQLFTEVQSEIARDLLRDPTARGILYVGGPEVRSDLPIVSGLEMPPADFSARVYVLGRRNDLDSHPALTPVFLEGDDRLNRHEFLLWLSEYSSYALIQRRGRGATWGFHTSDTAVVDGLIARLQAEYDLQPY
ncbi:MAG: response regulator [Myxococcaceae bacterium]